MGREREKERENEYKPIISTEQIDLRSHPTHPGTLGFFYWFSMKKNPYTVSGFSLKIVLAPSVSIETLLTRQFLTAEGFSLVGLCHTCKSVVS